MAAWSARERVFGTVEMFLRQRKIPLPAAAAVAPDWRWRHWRIRRHHSYLYLLNCEAGKLPEQRKTAWRRRRCGLSRLYEGQISRQMGLIVVRRQDRHRHAPGITAVSQLVPNQTRQHTFRQNGKGGPRTRRHWAD